MFTVPSTYLSKCVLDIRNDYFRKTFIQKDVFYIRKVLLKVHYCLLALHGTFHLINGKYPFQWFTELHEYPKI